MFVEKFRQIDWRKIRIVLLVVALILALASPFLWYFYMKAEARLAYREAKNARLYLRTLDIEYYGRGKTVYDGTRKSGLTDGVLEDLADYLETDCEMQITDYKKRTREITGFIYTRGKYQIVYRQDEKEGDTWKVNYLINILDYE